MSEPNPVPNPLWFDKKFSQLLHDINRGGPLQHRTRERLVWIGPAAADDRSRRGPVASVARVVEQAEIRLTDGIMNPQAAPCGMLLSTRRFDKPAAASRTMRGTFIERCRLVSKMTPGCRALAVRAVPLHADGPKRILVGGVMRKW